MTVILGLLLLTTIFTMQTVVKTLAENQGRALVQVSAQGLERELATIKTRLIHLAKKIEPLTSEPTKIQQTAQAYADLWPAYSPQESLVRQLATQVNFVVTDAAGGLIYADEPARIAGVISQIDFQNLQANFGQQLLLLPLSPPSENRQHSFVFIHPLLTETQKISGVLLLQFTLTQDWLKDYLPLPSNEGDQTYLIDSQGQLIAQTEGGITPSINPEIFRQVWQQAQPRGSLVIQPSGSERMIINYATLQSNSLDSPLPWRVVRVTPWSMMAHSMNQALWFISLALGTGLLGLSLLVLWSVQRITARLRLLVEQANLVATGTYNHQENLSYILEIRELGQAFNYMVSQLTSYRTGLQEYVASVTESQEEERKRIARDLHDGTIQTLIAIGQRIELIRDDLTNQSAAASQQQLTDLRGMVTETIDGIRQYSRDLRPLTLEDLGLIPALHYLLNRLNQDTGAEVDLHTEGEVMGLSQDLEVTIFRLVQESLNNIRKHAEASHVWVVVRFLPRQTILEIRDNGVGFVVPDNTTDLARNGSFGLLGLEERAHLFGGDLSIQSALQQGTIVKVILPHQQMPRRRLDVEG